MNKSGFLLSINVKVSCNVLSSRSKFSDEELKGSNTDGTHGKHPLDSSKLNSLRVLVFSKFPVECTTERDKLWRQIKAKINDRCRAIKYAKRAN